MLLERTGGDWELRCNPQLLSNWRMGLPFTMFPLTLMLLCAVAPRGPSIHTRDSLSLREGIYSSLFFTAEPVRSPRTNLPLQYRFTESGETPPGMKFEAYPCHKPHMPVCPQLATSNGTFLDGTPTETGSYTFVLTATDIEGRKTSQRFTVAVHDR